MSPPLSLLARVATTDGLSAVPLQVVLLVVIGAIAAALVAWLLLRERAPTAETHPAAATPASSAATPQSCAEEQFIPDGSAEAMGVVDGLDRSAVAEQHPYDALDLRGGSAVGDGTPGDQRWIRRELLERFPELEDYPLSRCRIFVEGLGDAVVDRALTFFTLIRDRGAIDSIELAARLEVPAQTISGALTGRMTRRATELDLSIPYAVKRRSGRTIWIDRSRIAGRMVMALAEERVSRAAARTAAEHDAA